ncbi:DnaD domain protein [Piscibacillus salipiscarius]|uniref:DnaD domain protein n=1 Tax=Piscibacillus salipiscarius TaxID=299480 RepID=A0ABW5Q7A4_9BACI
MNYLKELNTFHEWLDTNPLPSGAIVLWYTLMALNNKTNWQGEFTVANGTLQAKTGLSRQQLHRARTDLINAGRIKYKKSNRVNQAGKYSIVSFDTRDGHKADTEEYTNRTQSGQELSTLVKHKQDINKTKHIPSLANARVIHLAEQYFISISERDKYLLNDFCDELGEELITEALNRAKTELKGFKYALGIIRNWSQKGIQSIDEVRKDDENFEFYKQRKYGNGQHMPEYDPDLDGF